MDLPRPTDQHRRLAAFAGDWEGDETLHAAPPMRPATTKARGRFRSRMAVDGMFLVVDYEEDRDGVPLYGGHGVYGYDAKAGAWTMHWFDRMGSAPERVIHGRFEGDVLTFEGHAPFGTVRYVYELHGPDTFSFAIRSSRDGGATWQPFHEGRYRRVK